MVRFRILALAAAVGLLIGVPTAKASAQISIGIHLGPAPVCPYGYFDYAPYNCAPYGYYGPSWFNGGIFIGAGPWFHGPRDFHGRVDNHFDPHYGYRGPLPERGRHADHDHPVGHDHNFRGDEERDGRGHEYHQSNQHGHNNHAGDHHENNHDNGHHDNDQHDH